jgi:UDP:flavonoid glycosyltransferase YjiC (YdhE family)
LATLAICVFPTPSVITSAIALGRRLQRRGHDVWVISTPDAEGCTRAAGIAFRPVLAGLFRRGSLAAEMQHFLRLSRLAKLREIRCITRHYGSIMDGLLVPGRNELDEAFDRIGPDLVLCYSDNANLVVAPLVALRRGLRCAYLTPLFSSYFDPASPPLTTGLVPRRGVLSRLSVRLAWARYLIQTSVLRRLAITAGFDVDLPRYVKEMSPRKGEAGWPVDWRCFLAPKLSLPEFFLAPRALEFPARPRDGHHWLGWCFDSERPDEPFPYERLDPSRPLVYCAMGSHFLAFVPAPRQRIFLQAVIDAMAARPHLQLALATGGEFGEGSLDGRAPDAIVLERMPQLELLSRARLMITHCGLHSLMECTAHGVPMIAFPLGFDQSGNAARLVYHGLGLRADYRRATAASIGRLIDAVLGDEAIKRRCAAMAEEARTAECDDSALAALEALCYRDAVMSPEQGGPWSSGRGSLNSSRGAP